MRHISSSVYSSDHPAGGGGGGAHTALALARRGHGNRKPIFVFMCRSKRKVTCSSSSSSSSSIGSSGTTTAMQQHYNSTTTAVRSDQSPTAARSSTAGAGWDLHFFYGPLPSPGEAFHAPRSRRWGSSAVVSPGTPRAHVWGRRGTGVRSLGAGWRGGRAESYKCAAVLRAGRIALLARDHLSVILARHVYISRLSMGIYTI